MGSSADKDLGIWQQNIRPLDMHCIARLRRNEYIVSFDSEDLRIGTVKDEIAL